jgi:hypothetical protein
MNTINHNKALEKYQKLLGTWELSGSHRLIPGVVLTGTCVVTWLEEGGLVTVKTVMDQKEIPEMFAVIGHDDKNDPENDTMLYFDVRGVSRIMEVSLDDKEWRYWRTAPHFSQRFTGTFQDDGNTIIGLSELCEDDRNWKDDLKLTYTRK